MYAFSIILYGLLIHKLSKIPGEPFTTLPFIGITALFVVYWLSIFLKPATRLQCHIIGASIAIALFVSECFLEFTGVFVPKDLALIKHQQIDKMQVSYDKRSKYEVIQDYRAQKTLVYPSVHPHNEFLDTSLKIQNAKIFPVGGISHAQTILCNELGTYAEYRSDQFGFNNPANIYEKKIDIALIGDSVVHGSCVSPQQNLRQQIENKVKGNILNLGMGGAGPLLELAGIVEYASFYRPKVVLWMFAETNDLADLSNELKDDILKNYLNPAFSQQLMAKQSLIDGALTDYVEGKLKNYQKEEYSPDPFWNSSLKNILYLRHLRHRLGLYNRISAQPFAEFEQVLLLAKQRVEGWGGKLIVVYLPSYPSIKAKRDPALEHIYQHVLAITQKLDLQTIDLKIALESENDPLQYYPFRLPGHFTPEGYALLATKITDQLEAS